MENKTNEIKSKLPEIGTKEFNNLAAQYFGGKFEEKSTKELALEWFNNLYYGNKIALISSFLNKTDYIATDKEIEEIWRKEIQVKELSNAYHNIEYLKPNQKQFKEFNPELFDSYNLKFSEKDRFQLAEIAVNNCNMSFDDTTKIIEIIRKYR